MRMCTRILKCVSLDFPGASQHGARLWAHLFCWRSAGAACGANRAGAQGPGRGASLLKGSCNFHSRVLLKLALRPPEHPSHTAPDPQLGERLDCCSVCVNPPALTFQTNCTRQTSISQFLHEKFMGMVSVVCFLFFFFSSTHKIHNLQSTSYFTTF